MARILIVEDEPLIALLLEEWLVELGHEPVGPLATVDQAIESLTKTEIDAAILDVNLHGRRCDPVAEALVARGVPFAVATGSSLAELGGKFVDRPSVSKPYIFESIRDVMSKLLAGGMPISLGAPALETPPHLK